MKNLCTVLIKGTNMGNYLVSMDAAQINYSTNSMFIILKSMLLLLHRCSKHSCAPAKKLMQQGKSCFQPFKSIPIENVAHQSCRKLDQTLTTSTFSTIATLFCPCKMHLVCWSRWATSLFPGGVIINFNCLTGALKCRKSYWKHRWSWGSESCSETSQRHRFLCHNKTWHITDDGQYEAMDEPLSRTKNHFIQLRNMIKHTNQTFFSIYNIRTEMRH